MASYATTDDLIQLSLNPNVFASIPSDTLQKQIDAASSEAEGYLADQYHLPIVAPYPSDLKMHVCNIAAFYLMSFRGYRPDSRDEIIRQRYEDAIAWLKGIAKGMITPAGIIDSTPTTREGAPTVISGATGNVIGGFGNSSTGRRGW